MGKSTKVYTFKVGSNNTTGELEIEKLTDVLDRHFEGYEITPTVGMYKGEQENSARVEVIEDLTDLEIQQICKEIKEELEQIEVAVTETGIGYLI